MKAGKPIERRLAAIMAADVVGYSRLMGADEIGTLRALQGHRRELIDPKIATYHGRIVKTTGDGLLIEFPSAVEAVTCAIAVQQGVASRNANVAEDKRLVFRVGINVGDIISEDGDIFGDGVNVAARLESLGKPGGLCISRAVRDQVRDKLPVTFEDFGEQQVKNIARPVRAFGLAPEAIATIPELAPQARRASSGRAHLWITAGFIAVLIAGGRRILDRASAPDRSACAGTDKSDRRGARLDRGPAIGGARGRGRRRLLRRWADGRHHRRARAVSGSFGDVARRGVRLQRQAPAAGGSRP